MSNDLSSVRADKWIWAARFFKTRSLASQAIEQGRVKLDDQLIKPARMIRVGDKLSIRVQDQWFVVVVKGLSEQRGPASFAQTLYEETPQSKTERLNLQALKKFTKEPAQTIKGGRPTKDARRQLEAWTRHWQE